MTNGLLYYLQNAKHSGRPSPARNSQRLFFTAANLQLVELRLKRPVSYQSKNSCLPIFCSDNLRLYTVSELNLAENLECSAWSCIKLNQKEDVSKRLQTSHSITVRRPF